MHIKSNVFYNKSTGSYDGFTSYGKDIILADDGTAATEALVLMLVSFRGEGSTRLLMLLLIKLMGTTYIFSFSGT